MFCHNIFTRAPVNQALAFLSAYIQVTCHLDISHVFHFSDLSVAELLLTLNVPQDSSLLQFSLPRSSMLCIESLCPVEATTSFWFPRIKQQIASKLLHLHIPENVWQGWRKGAGPSQLPQVPEGGRDLVMVGTASLLSQNGRNQSKAAVGSTSSGPKKKKKKGLSAYVSAILGWHSVSVTFLLQHWNVLSYYLPSGIGPYSSVLWWWFCYLGAGTL